MCHAVRNTSGTLAAWLKSSAVGDRDDIHCGDSDQLAIPAVHAVAEHGELRAQVLKPGRASGAVIAEMHGREQDPLPRLEASDVLAHLGNLARDVSPQNVWHGHPRQAFADPKIDVVESAGLDANQNPVVPWLRIRHILVTQDFRTTEFMDADGFHGSSEMKSNYHTVFKESQFGTWSRFTNHRQRGHPSTNVAIDMPESGGRCQWVLDTACHAGEWCYQPLRFESAALRGDHSHKLA